MPLPLRLLATSLLLCALASRAWAGIDSLQLVDESEKLVSGRAIDELPDLQLFAIKDETLAFQLLLRADQEGLQGVSLAIEGLGDVRAQVFREDLIPIRERSHELAWKPGSAAEPEGMGGDVPDRLVPIDDRVFSLAGGEQRRLWIDLWIPPQAQPGVRTGSLRVRCAPPCQDRVVPMQLEILDRLMPTSARARTMLWFSGGDPKEESIVSRYFSESSSASEADKRELRRKHYQLARQHRITLFWGHESQPNDELRELLSGEMFSESAGYQGPAARIGQDLMVLEAYGGELTQASARDWLAFAKAFASLRSVFVYVMDEPRASDFDEANRRVEVSRPMPAFITSIYDPRLHADIFAAPAWLYRRAKATQAREAGKEQWIYNGARPFTGSFVIDDRGVSPRVNAWIQYKFDIERWFYWEATYYDDFQGKRGAVDVMAEGINFSNRHGDRMNGDGLLIYPGRDHLFPDSDAGFDGPLASIRLKNWRRGIEDVEYLVMARAAGFDDEVDALLDTMVPQALDQMRAGAAVSWPEDAATWRQARRYLFELLRDGHSDLRVEKRPGNGPPRRAQSHRHWLLVGAAVLVLLAALRMRWRRQRPRA